MGRKFTWKRASEIYGAKVNVVDGIEITDIEQGELG